MWTVPWILPFWGGFGFAGAFWYATTASVSPSDNVMTLKNIRFINFSFHFEFTQGFHFGSPSHY